jgi:uncharacterized spore protein YtfJ
MTTQNIEPSVNSIIDNLRGTRDAMSVNRVFGDPYSVDGVTIVPVARVSGGAGGGGGGGTGPNEEGGQGFGTGFGVGVQAVGVFEIRNGQLCWKPAVDVNRIIRGSQVLAGVISVCVSLVFIRRQR